MFSTVITQIINIYIIVSIFIIFIMKKKYYEYKRHEEEKEEKEEREELEYKFQFYSDKIFYLTVFKILYKNGLIKDFIDIEKMMEDAFVLYHEDSMFRNQCYKYGIRRRFVEYMEENKKNK